MTQRHISDTRQAFEQIRGYAARAAADYPASSYITLIQELCERMLAEPVHAGLTDKDRLDFLDRCNARLNAYSGTSYFWKLILNHNVNRLMCGHLAVDLSDMHADGMRSCRAAIDQEIQRVARDARPVGGAA